MATRNAHPSKTPSEVLQECLYNECQPSDRIQRQLLDEFISTGILPATYGKPALMNDCICFIGRFGKKYCTCILLLCKQMCILQKLTFQCTQIHHYRSTAMSIIRIFHVLYSKSFNCNFRGCEIFQSNKMYFKGLSVCQRQICISNALKSQGFSSYLNHFKLLSCSSKTTRFSFKAEDRWKNELNGKIYERSN